MGLFNLDTELGLGVACIRLCLPQASWLSRMHQDRIRGPIQGSVYSRPPFRVYGCSARCLDEELPEKSTKKIQPWGPALTLPLKSPWDLGRVT